MATGAPGLEQHPDLATLRARYEMAAENPVAHTVDGLMFLTGLYLAVSPWVVGFAGFRSLTINNLIIGLALAALAVGLASANGRTHGVTWVAPVIGVWTIISPWVVRGGPPSGGTIWNNVVTGVIAVLLGIVATVVGVLGGRGDERVRRISAR